MIDIKKKEIALHTDIKYLNTDVFFGMNFNRIGSGLVISRDSSGTPICHFEDYEWSFPDLKFQVKDNCNFSLEYLMLDTSAEQASTFFCKKIFLMRMFFPESKTGQPIRLPSMHVNNLLLRKLFFYAEEQKVSMQKVFLDSSLFEVFIGRLPITLLKEMKVLMRTLNRISIVDLGFSVNGAGILGVNRKIKAAFKAPEQHPVIPSRILWEKYNQYKDCIKDFNEYAIQLSGFISEASSNPYYARARKARRTVKNLENLISSAHDSNIDFSQSIRNSGLQELQTKYKWRSISSLASYLAMVQYCCKSLIHILTLMRHHEVLELCTGCLEPVRGWNHDALYIASISTKLTGTLAPNKWITIDAVVEPIQTLAVINSMISPYVTDANSREQLFLSTAILPLCGGSDPQQTRLVGTIDSESKLQSVLITEADILELEAIDPFRNWRADKKFEIGNPWKVTSHQFRRSIAVFAGQSELITFPSLKRLLNHVTKVMSAYYMKGCSANNYIFGLLNPELTLEMKRAKADADTALYIRNVVRSEQELYGFHGSRVMQERVNSPWLHDSLEATAKQVRLGLLAYEETPIGGCVSNKPCDKRAHGNFNDCPGCPNSALNPQKIEETIKLVEWDLAELQPGTIEYKAELRNLDDYKNIQKLVLKKGGK